MKETLNFFLFFRRLRSRHFRQFFKKVIRNGRYFKLLICELEIIKDLKKKKEEDYIRLLNK